MWRVFLFLLPMLSMLPMHELYRLYGLNYKADIKDAVKSWFFFEALKLGYLIHLHPLDNAHAEHTTKKVLQVFRLTGLCCGERGIRTPGTSQYAGFQDRCIRPLCHLSNRGNAIDVALQSQWITIPFCFISGCKVTLFSSYLQIFGLLFSSDNEKSLISAPLNVTKAITSPLKSTKTSLLVLQCLRFAVTLNKLRCTSTIKICRHILYCLRFAVTLHLWFIQATLKTRYSSARYARC